MFRRAVSTMILVSVFPLVTLAIAKFPKVISTVGTPMFTDREGKTLIPKADLVLREKAKFVTDSRSQVRIALDEKRILIVLENTEMVIPSISLESGEAPIIILQRGQIRWRQTDRATYNVSLNSPLTQFLAPLGDYVLGFFPDKALAELLVIRGSMEFSAMNGEDVRLVKDGQKVSFEGVLEGNEVAYDVLLQGKKIPRGKLSQVSNLSSDEQKVFSEDSEKKIVQQEMTRRKIEAKKHQAKPGQICEAPFAKLNECVWRCLQNPKKEKQICRIVQGAKCMRSRCNANGQWVDETQLSSTAGEAKCLAKPVVAPCDY